MANKRHTYTHDELEQYFDRVSMPKSQRVYNVSSLQDWEKLAFLDLIQKHQLVKIPWENLVQHYSWHHTVNVNPKHLFRKIVQDPGRGGYCMEVNYFYHVVLYSLGFDIYMAGSRIYNPDKKTYGGWTHVVNLVSVAGTRYLVDGGFGPNGPSCPVALEHGVASTGITPAEIRVMHEPIADNLDQSQKVWTFQHRNDENSPWIPMYCFTDMEFTPNDVASMNFAPALNRQSFFTHKVVANRFTTEKEKDGPEGPGSANEKALDALIDGALTINHGTLKWRRHGKKVVVIEFKKDEERVEALRKYFGITLSDEDQEAIINTTAQIEVGAMGSDD